MRRKNKKESKEKEDKCATCSIGEAQIKKLEELFKNRVKPKDCPLLKTCKKYVLREEWEAMCKDQEVVQDVIRIHMQGRHVWELCGAYLEEKRKREGKLPKDWK